MDSVLVYASGYPNYDWEQPDAITDRLPAAWHQKIFHDNAMEFFRWPGQVTQSSAADRAPVSMGDLAERP
jgi:hypothetical protein